MTNEQFTKELERASQIKELQDLKNKIHRRNMLIKSKDVRIKALEAQTKGLESLTARLENELIHAENTNGYLTTEVEKHKRQTTAYSTRLEKLSDY